MYPIRIRIYTEYSSVYVRVMQWNAMQYRVYTNTPINLCTRCFYPFHFMYKKRKHMKENDVELGTFSTVLTPNTIFEIIKCHSTAHGMKKEGAQTHCAANITFSAQARTHHTAAVHRISHRTTFTSFCIYYTLTSFLVSCNSNTSADTFCECRSTPGLISTSQLEWIKQKCTDFKHWQNFDEHNYNVEYGIRSFSYLSCGLGFPPSLMQANVSSEFSLTGTKIFPASKRRESMSRYGGFGRSAFEFDDIEEGEWVRQKERKRKRVYYLTTT